MPAIQPNRLKLDAAKVAENFPNTTAIISELDGYFNFYADRTKRVGQATATTPLLLTYNIPRPAMRQLRVAFQPYLSDTGYMLGLVDALWDQEAFEFKLLAVYLLGDIDADAETTLLRILEWAKNTDEEQLLKVLLAQEVITSKEIADMLIAQIETMLLSDALQTRALGLRLLTAFHASGENANIPHTFSWIRPLVLRGEDVLQPYLRDILHTLAQISPTETAFFLLSNLQETRSKHVAWFTRQTLAAFPERHQKDLKSGLRQNSLV